MGEHRSSFLGTNTVFGLFINASLVQLDFLLLYHLYLNGLLFLVALVCVQDGK